MEAAYVCRPSPASVAKEDVNEGDFSSRTMSSLLIPTPLVSEIPPGPSEGAVGNIKVTDVVATTTMCLLAPIVAIGEVSLGCSQEAVVAEAGSSLGLGASIPS